jgi:hypothetical protein
LDLSFLNLYSFVIEKIRKTLKYEYFLKIMHVICCSITNNYQLDIQESTQVCGISTVDTKKLTQ